MDELLNDGRVRTTNEAVKRVSAIDVLKLVLDMNNNNAASTLKKLLKDNPEVTILTGNFKFSGAKSYLSGYTGQNSCLWLL
jgi:hypothetical protein